MALRIRYKPEATRDLEAIDRWYEEQRKGLGADFLDDLAAAEQRLRVNPEHGVEVDLGVRRVSLAAFPYSVYYFIEAQEIVILSVRHGRRKTKRWIVSEAPVAYAP